MAEQTDIADRVNALLRAESPPPAGRRRRSFVAALASTTEVTKATALPSEPELTPISEDDDLPVLTEVVPTEVAAVPAENQDDIDDAKIAALISEMAQAIGEQMAFELPTLIEATLLNIGEELRAGITSTMEMALREFVAHRKQLRLPLDEPENR